MRSIAVFNGRCNASQVTAYLSALVQSGLLVSFARLTTVNFDLAGNPRQADLLAHISPTKL